MRDVREMRELLEQERPPKGDWDLKLSPGGLVDIEFAAQFLQLAHAADGGPLEPNTAEALGALAAADLVAPAAVAALSDAWRLQQNLTQLIKVALSDDPRPSEEPRAFQALLARAGGVKTFKALERRLAEAQAAARKAYLAVVKG